MSDRRGFIASTIILAALALSVGYFLFMPQYAQINGALMALWGCIALAHIVWILQTLQVAESGSTQVSFNAARSRASLSSGIMQALSHEGNRRHVTRAVGLIRPRFIGSAALFLLFVVMGLSASFLPAPTLDIYALQNASDSSLTHDITNYMSANNLQSSLAFDPFYHVRINAFVQIIWIALVFWVAKIGVRSAHFRSGALRWCGGIFAISLTMAIWRLGFTADIFDAAIWRDSSLIGIGWGHQSWLQDMELIPRIAQSSFALRLYEVGIFGSAALYMSGAMLLACYVRRAWSRALRRQALITAIFVMTALIICDLFLVSSAPLQALWLSGWAYIGVLLTHASSTRK